MAVAGLGEAGDEAVLFHLNGEKANVGKMPRGVVVRELSGRLPARLTSWLAETRHHFGTKPVGLFVLYPPKDFAALVNTADSARKSARDGDLLLHWQREGSSFQLRPVVGIGSETNLLNAGQE